MDRETRARKVREILRLVFWLNVSVVGIKLGVWFLSHALSVLAEVGHSSLDAANNVFALAMARVAGKGPDDDHPYGHQKFETLGALVLVGALSVTVFELLKQAVFRFLRGGGADLHVDAWSISLMAVGAVAGLAISRFESRAGKHLGSDLLLADAAHTRADVFTTVSVLAGLLAVRWGYPVADPLATVIVAALIAHTGWEILQETVPVLVDSRAVHPEHIEGLALSVDGVRSAYHIRSRGQAGEVFAELTIAVDPDLDVATSHAIADEVERRVARSLSARQVVIHVEPYE